MINDQCDGVRGRECDNRCKNSFEKCVKKDRSGLVVDIYSMKKAPAAATMATKPWPTAKTLAAPLNVDGLGVAPPAGVLAAGVVTPGAEPVAAGTVELPAMG